MIIPHTPDQGEENQRPTLPATTTLRFPANLAVFRSPRQAHNPKTRGTTPRLPAPDSSTVQHSGRTCPRHPPLAAGVGTTTKHLGEE